MQYLSVLLVLMSTIVAVRGSTWDDKATGLKRVTTTGWATLVIALAGFVVAVASVHRTDVKSAEAQALAKKSADALAASEQKITIAEAKLSAYQDLVRQVKDYSERQMQLVMIQAVTVNPGHAWQAPNLLYPGSEVKVFFFRGNSVTLRYGTRAQVLSRDSDGWAHALIIGDSGSESSWEISSNGPEPFEGKVEVFSTPRSRSRDWSWLEERLGTTVKAAASR